MTDWIVRACGLALRRISTIAVAILLAGCSSAVAQPQLPAPGTPTVYSPWIKFCGKEPNNPAATEVCRTATEARMPGGSLVPGAALIEPAGVAGRVLRIMLPGRLDRELRVTVDKDEAIAARATVCLPNACMVDFDVDADFVMRLKAGHTLTLSGADASAGTITHVLPLAGFARANEGPPIRCGDVVGAAACAREHMRQRDK